MNAAATSWPADVHVLIPAFRSAPALGKWLPDLLRAVPASNIRIVDDASEDATSVVCRDLGLSTLVHDRNRGKGAALSTGFTHLLGRGAGWVITMDADGQHSIGDLPSFIQATSGNCGMIIGFRTMRTGIMPPARICSNIITSRILSLMSRARILDSQCGFRAYSARLLRVLPPPRYQRFEMESEVILRARHLGFTIGWVPVQTLYFADGASHISHFADTLRWIRAVAGVYWSLRRSRPRSDH